MAPAHDDLISLGAAMTGLIAIPLAIMTFFIAREKQRGKGPATSGLFIVLAAGLYTLAADAGAWWAWFTASTSATRFALETRREVFLTVLFGPPALFAAGAAVWAFCLLVARAWHRLTASPP